MFRMFAWGNIGAEVMTSEGSIGGRSIHASGTRGREGSGPGLISHGRA